VMDVNERQKLHLLPQIRTYFGGQVKGLHFAVWGLAFKPNTDDIREAPALEIIEVLLQEGATVSAFDPEAMPNVQRLLGDRIKFGHTAYDVIDGADALIIATEWNEFRTPDFNALLHRLGKKVIFDGRNLFDVADMHKKGFDYISIGRQKSLQTK
jgi:UDPglucose 6-dehydrogenase